MPRTGAIASSAPTAVILDTTMLRQNTVLWLDASDTSTMFADVAGTQPVGADNKVRCWTSKSSLKNNRATAPEVAGDGTYHATYVPGLLKGGTMGAFSDNTKGLALLLNDSAPLAGCSGLTLVVVLQPDVTAGTSVIAPVMTKAFSNISWCCRKTGTTAVLDEALDRRCAPSTSPIPVLQTTRRASVMISQRP